MVEKVEYIWLDDRLVPWDEANTHVITHSLHYGCAVFEGIRSYTLHDGTSAVFRLADHVHRHFMSAKIMEIQIPLSEEQVYDAILTTLKANKMKAGYIRPLSFIGGGVMGVHPGDNPVHTCIVVWPWGAYLGEEALEKGITLKTSTLTRHYPNSMMTKAKVAGNYVNSVLAKREALADGYQEALLLDVQGYVAEATGENIFIVQKGEVLTPPLTAVLEGLTRHTVICLLKDMGYTVKEEFFSRDAIYGAEEVFLCGSAAEITPVRSLDRRVIGAGAAGPVTQIVQKEYFKLVQGSNARYASWLDRYTLD